MKLTKFGILVRKTANFFTSIRDGNISRGCIKILKILEGRGVNFWGRFWKIHRGEGIFTANPFCGGGMDIFCNYTLQQPMHPKNLKQATWLKMQMK